MDRIYLGMAAVAASGVTKANLVSWAKRDQLRVGSDPIHGKATRYSFADLLALRVMRELVERGVSAGPAGGMVKEMRGHLEAIEHDPPGAEPRLYVHGWQTCEGHVQSFAIGAASQVLHTLTARDPDFGPVTSAIVLNLSALAADVRARLPAPEVS